MEKKLNIPWEGVKGLGLQVISSDLPVRNWDPGRSKRIDQLNDWLHVWCHTERYGFDNLGHFFDKLGMLTWDGTQLTGEAKIY